MPLKPLTYREVKRKLESAGFEIKSQRGSHVKFVKETPYATTTVIVPFSRTDLRIGTLKGIIDQSQMTVDEFMAL